MNARALNLPALSAYATHFTELASGETLWFVYDRMSLAVAEKGSALCKDRAVTAAAIVEDAWNVHAELGR